MKHFLALTLALLSLVPALGQNSIEPKMDINKLWGYCIEDKWIIPSQYERAFSYSEDVACVRLNGKFGYINIAGEVVINFRFDNAFSFSEGLAAVNMNGKWGFITHSGASIVSYRFDNAKSFTEGLAAVNMNGKWGFIDREGVCKIPYKYDNVNSFSEGLAAAEYDRKWGFIDVEGNWYDAKEEYIPKFSNYAKRYVEQQINKWQIKGKYEKTVAWQERVNEKTREQKVSEFTKEAESQYINEFGKTINISQRLSDYDADNEIFLIKDDNFGDLLVPVPIDDAPKFEEEFYKMKRTVRYFIENDKLGLAEMKFYNNENKLFTYSNQASLDYFVTRVNYQFAPIEIDQNAITKMERGEQNVRYAQLNNSEKSDVDINIPQAKTTNDNTFAVIIANELYKHEQPVDYAKTDGESFRNYCIKTLGLPEDRIHFSSDATLNEMRMAMHWITDIGEAFGEEAKVLFYYAGHGVADDASRSAFLLPVDGSGRDPESGYPVDKLYSQLGALPVESVVVMLDACFSGAMRDGEMMVASRGVAIKAKEAQPTGNLIIFSATTGDETAALYPQQGHGLFTYFLLKKLQESKGDCSLGDLVEFVQRRVNQESVVANKRPQTPTVICSSSMANSWKNIKLK
ncbi:MAG: WG repeat-containing protein [Alistipes sp.]|nr:WG repeat-containing protein [Alistipes sp.]